MLKFANTVLAVTDVERSIAFYEDVVGDRVVEDYGDNIVFESGLALCKVKDFEKETGKKVYFRNGGVKLSFTEADFDGFVNYLQEFDDIKFITQTETDSRGCRVVRFYDPDNHIIEVLEEMEVVVRRLLSEGMPIEQISEKTGFPVEYVKMVGKH